MTSMRRLVRLVAAVAAGSIIAGAATAQEVFIDYDRKASLTRYETYALAEPSEGESLAKRSPLAHQHLLKALKKRIEAGGRLTENTADPDLYVTYRVASEEGASMTPTGYVTGPGWSGGYYWAGVGWGSTSTTVDTYPVGTLVIDIWDAEAKRAVWRGVASDAVPEEPSRGIKKLDSVLDKLVEKWHSMRAQGK
jgi:hypothetical protein